MRKSLTSALGNVIETSWLEPTVNSPWSDLTTDAGLKSSLNEKKIIYFLEKKSNWGDELHLIVWYEYFDEFPSFHVSPKSTS